MGMLVGAATMENSVKMPQTFLKNRKLPYDPAMFLLGMYLKKMNTQTQRDTCIPMSMTALLAIAKIWKLPIHWQRSGQGKCCTRIILKELLPSATTPMVLLGIMLSEMGEGGQKI